MAARSDKPVAKATKARPPQAKKSPEMIKAICDKVIEGYSLERICRDPAMPSVVAVWHWYKNDPEFARQYDEARQARGDRYGERVADVVEAVKLGEIDYNTARIAIDAYKWAAARMAPKHYGDRVEATVNVVSTNEQHLTAVRELADLRRKQQAIEDNTVDVEAVAVE